MITNKAIEEQLLRKALFMAETGKSYGEIKKFLQSQTSDRDLITSIMKDVDKLILEKLANKKNKHKTTMMILGAMLAISVIFSLIIYLDGKGLYIILPGGGIIGYFFFNNWRNLSIKNNFTNEKRKFKTRY